MPPQHPFVNINHPINSRTNILSITTMATLPVYEELVLFLYSINIFHPNIPVFIITQKAVQEKLRQEKHLPKNITFNLALEKYRTQNWRNIGAKEAAEFLSNKTRAMETALKEYDNTLYADCDMLFLTPLGRVDDTKDLGLSPHYPSGLKKYGKYWAGWIFVSNPNFSRWWKKEILNSSHPSIDQFCLQKAVQHFSYFHFPREYNFHSGWYLKLCYGGSRKLVREHLNVQSHRQKGILYKGKPVMSIHQHLLLPSKDIFSSPHQSLGYQKKHIHICYSLIMLHLYEAYPDFFNYIVNKGNLELSGEQLKKHRLDFLILFIIMRSIDCVRKKRLVKFLNRRETLNKNTNITRYLYRITRFTLIPFLLVFHGTEEALFVYHAYNRSNNKRIKWQTALTSLIKLVSWPIYKNQFYAALPTLRSAKNKHQ